MLEKLANETIWTDLERRRFFLIPDGQELPLGEFRIFTITGRKQSVDPAALASFERTEAEAKEWLRSQFGVILDSLHAGAEALIRKLEEREN